MNTIFPNDIITEQDIQNIISNALEESVSLEFKAADALDKSNDHTKEIWKDVSSFANSGGGVLIYGISEKNHKADSLSFIDGNKATKEWLEQTINSNIHRRIDGLKIDPVRFGNLVDQSIYVLQIPESSNAPHMAKDNRYYKRFNFMAVPMEEYEVRNLYGRMTKTELQFDEISWQQGAAMGPQGYNVYQYVNFVLRIQVKNISRGIENQYKLELLIPHKVWIYSENNGDLKKYLMKTENGIRTVSLPGEVSIFQDETTTVAKINIKVTEETYDELVQGIKLKLYYTNGVKETTIFPLQICHYNGRFLTHEMLDWKKYRR
jgi:hypothetical protein